MISSGRDVAEQWAGVEEKERALCIVAFISDANQTKGHVLNLWLLKIWPRKEKETKEQRQQ